MYWLVETEEQVKNFKSEGYKEGFVEIIPYNSFQHPITNSISLIYIRPLNSTKGFIFPINHSEAFLLSEEIPISILETFSTLYVRDKKEFLHYIIHPKIMYLTFHNINYKLTLPTVYNFFQRKYENKKDLNLIIPIVKHYEYCEKIYNDLKPYIKSQHNTFLNNKSSVVFNFIEKNGIKIDPVKFSNIFYPTEEKHIYTNYNLKTTTGRPSNSFNNINYAALNKSNKSRESFIPQNQKFIEIDISAYHPTILSKIINYDFRGKDIHQYFADLYEVSYDKAKEITFQQLYGGVFEKYQHLKFFQEVDKYINSTWEKFEKEGFIECTISKKRFENSILKDMNPQKLLNYILQATETDLNVILLWDMSQILYDKTTKLVLYTYDSFLFDTLDEDKEVIDKIKDIFIKHNLKFKVKEGYNYDEMR